MLKVRVLHSFILVCQGSDSFNTQTQDVFILCGQHVDQTHTHTHTQTPATPATTATMKSFGFLSQQVATLVLLCLLTVGHNAFGPMCVMAQKNETDILTKDECKARVPYKEFATDNRIISCVRNASASCCEAMNELLGDESPVHFCTCSEGVLEDALDEAVPVFAKDIIHQRIEECSLPIAGDERCEGLYDDAGSSVQGDCEDEYPPDVDSQYTCEDQARFGKCGENWMQGFCNLSCERCEAAAAEGGENQEQENQEDKEGDAAKAAASDGECTDEYPPDVDTQYTCEDQAGFGKCEEGWMEGYCLASCDKCNTTSQRTS